MAAAQHGRSGVQGGGRGARQAGVLPKSAALSPACAGMWAAIYKTLLRAAADARLNVGVFLVRALMM